MTHVCVTLEPSLVPVLLYRSGRPGCRQWGRQDKAVTGDGHQLLSKQRGAWVPTGGCEEQKPGRLRGVSLLALWIHEGVVAFLPHHLC